MLCKVCPYQIVLSILLIFPLKRLRNHARFDPIHIDAESLQHDLPRRRARDDACLEGNLFCAIFRPRSSSRCVSILVLRQYRGRPLPVVSLLVPQERNELHVEVLIGAYRPF